MASGILSVVFAFAYYLIPLGLAFSIFAIINGRRCRRLYAQDPEGFGIIPMRNATIGWVAGIAGICVSIVFGLILVMQEMVAQ